MRKIFKELDEGQCAASGITHAQLRQLGLALVPRGARPMLLTVPYRIERCNADDLAVLPGMMTVVSLEDYPIEYTDGYSRSVEVNISFNELWESPPPSYEEIKRRVDGETYSLADWTVNRGYMYSRWPKYPADTRDPAWPKTDIPMLMLNGALDAETPIELALAARDHYHGPHQNFVILPGAPHGGAEQSPLASDPDGVNGTIPCGLDIVSSFVENPYGPLDLSCIPQMAPVNFDDAEYAYFYANSGSLWDKTAITYTPDVRAEAKLHRRPR